MSGCTASKAQTDLAINNVRARLFTSGDMWWNLVTAGGAAQYEVPKGGGVSSLFGGSIWVGGIDGGGQLKVAAMTYRQAGIDFWPGPLDTAAVSISASRCAYYDKHYVMTHAEVEDFVNGGAITANIKAWPGNGDYLSNNEARSLAPFFDKVPDGIYNPEDGDYPKYSLTSKKFPCDERQIFGDRTLWWVFNDKGNVHGQTNGIAIGIEVRAQAFAFSSTDEINNMTFYDYEVINRSSFQLNKTYFGQWVDPDLGCSQDDYVGCDVGKGLGFCYNGDGFDEPCQGGLGYGTNPPAVGVDFFRGPRAADPGDGLDANGVSFVEPTGRIGMAKFIYYNNDNSVTGEPNTAQHHYGYLSGFWKDGTPITYGGNGKVGTVNCDFMFPGDSDPTGRGTNNSPQPIWSEASVGNAPADRRFIQSAGPFTLKPGAVNNITVGAVWAKAIQGGQLASVQLLKNADIKAQALFNNCFNILNGPDAPDITIQELDKQLILYLTNKATSNNYKEGYQEKDPYMGKPQLPALPSDTSYLFEGYQIYQIIDSSVAVTELGNPDKARIIFQTDLKNGHGQLVNFYLNQALGGVWVPQEMVNGGDSGVSRSFVVKKDLFAKGDDKLINHKQYYFMAVAYGYNHGEYNIDPNQPLNGYNLPYISSRRNIKSYTGIPHIITPEANGTLQQANYGDGVRLKRIEGQGNGGRVLDLTAQSTTDILKSGLYSATNTNGARVIGITYERGAGPIDVKVVDPLNIPDGCYEITVSDSVKTARWTLRNTATGAIVAKSDTTILVGGEQIIPSLGLSVRAKYTYDVAYANAPGASGYLESSVVFADQTKRWLFGLPDAESTTNQNWIRSGKFTDKATNAVYDDYAGVDDAQDFENIAGGTIAPYRLCAYSDPPNYTCVGGPAWEKNIQLNNIKLTLASVDIVITSDRSKWTRCPVLELQEEKAFAEGGEGKMDLRSAPSVDKDGKNTGAGGLSDPTNENAADYIAPYGMGWFPGYAINVETGERLNMAFGEDSGLPLENGRDMKWNPSANVFSFPGFKPIFGGKHYVYVFSHVADQKQLPTDPQLPSGPKNIPRYDGGYTIWQLLNTNKAMGVGKNDFYKRVVYGDAMWVTIPILAPNHALLECDVKVKIRVARKFRYGFSGLYGLTNTSQAVLDSVPSGPINRNFPMYSFCTTDLVTKKGENTVAKNALDIINVVPNPYYAYSGYEANQTDNEIKITNLPEKCTIRIYSLNGTLIRTFNKDDPKTSLNWNLQNQAKIPVASGLYIIHVNAPGVGEKILKWFGVMRPIDLDSY